MRFIETTNGNLVNLDFVRKIIIPRDEKKATAALFGPEGDDIGEVWQLDIIASRLGQMVPAISGYTVIYADVDDNAAITWEETIIAFSIGQDVWPYTVEGPVSEHATNWGIKCPDGRVIIPQCRAFDDEKEFLENCVKEHKKEKSRLTEIQVKEILK